MTLIRRPSPFREMVTLRDTIDRLFDESLLPRPLLATQSELGMPFDIRVTPDAVVVEAALPGAKPEDVEITVTGSTLTITATTATEREEKDQEFLLREIRRGSFSRTIALPEGLQPDRATARFEHGLLTLSIPKAEVVKPKQIRISPAVDGRAEGAAGATAAPAGSGTREA
ncbi:MAG: Hsp20/alpha crystallin family protein [Chloroflexi bacterium]|nr:Hsp20/alpha crystallin family protein [Chloroflexota bacterium]